MMYSNFMHPRLIQLLIVLLVIVAAALYLSRESAPAAISILSPLSGTSWMAGEEQEITWKTSGVPASDKISVTIRRLPPPPLPEEGQEFDPIVFTNLPNTGSATWTISSMYPSGTYVLGIAAYKSVPVTNAITGESAPFTISHPALSPALTPLYDKATWLLPEVETFTIGTTTFHGTSVTSVPQNAGADMMNLSAVITPFEKYYDQKLKSLGYTIDNGLAAGGHVGGQTGYQKDGETILTRFSIDYQNKPGNAPSECPCTVTLSLFSGAVSK